MNSKENLFLVFFSICSFYFSFIFGRNRVSSQPSGSSLSSTEIVPESDLKERSTKKKKKKKRKNSKGEEQGNEVRGDEAGTTNKNDGLAVQPEAAHDK